MDDLGGNTHIFGSTPIWWAYLQLALGGWNQLWRPQWVNVRKVCNVPCEEAIWPTKLLFSFLVSTLNTYPKFDINKTKDTYSEHGDTSSLVKTKPQLLEKRFPWGTPLGLLSCPMAYQSRSRRWTWVVFPGRDWLSGYRCGPYTATRLLEGSSQLDPVP